MSEKRVKMKPIVVDNIIYHCQYEMQWPPAHAWTTDTPAYLRGTGAISEVDFQRIQVWQRVCGIRKMDMARCQSCPHLMIETAKGMVSAKEVEKPATMLPPCGRRPKAIRTKNR